MGFFETDIDGIPCWKHSDLSGKVFHGFFGKGLDARALDNARIAEMLGVPSISLLTQVHGTDIVSIKNASCKADGFFLRKGEGACGIKTADCVPLLITDSEHTLAAILHCGWRGTVEGIVYEAISRFRKENILPETLHVYTGPAAQICCYEIGKDLGEQFISASSKGVSSKDLPSEILPVENREGKYYGSVSAIIQSQLLASSIPYSNIHILGECTICSEKYYSHRRGDEERLLSFVVM